MLAAQLEQTLEFQDYPKNMMLHVLNQKVVCGGEKNCYKTSCYTRRHGTEGIKSYDVETALDYPFIYYSTTFKRNNIDRPEIIKALIVDVDYLPVASTKQMHKIISDKVLTPTFTTRTSKGYQFMFALSTPFILSDKGTRYAKSINDAIIDKFENVGIKVDHAASSRLTSTFRNPLVHQHEFSNLTYSAEQLKEHFKLNYKNSKKQNKSISATVTNKNQSSAKYESQKKILDAGFVEGNRNEYFYLLANKECVLQNIQNYNDALMICNLVADDLSFQNPTIDKIPDSEIKATASQLFKYKSNNSLYMPTIFCTSKRDINAGRYRQELNATVGYCNITTRRSAAMSMIQRDRRDKTIRTIRNTIATLPVEDFNNHTIYSISQKIALLTNLSTSTVYRYLQADSTLLSVTLTLRLKKINVLDFMKVPNIGDSERVRHYPVNTNNYEPVAVYRDLCISDATEAEIELYEWMGWEIMPF